MGAQTWCSKRGRRSFIEKSSRQCRGSQISCAALRALSINSREQFIKEQREDPELGHIYRYLENPDDGSVNATVGKFMPKFEGPYKVLEIKGNNLVIWKNGRNIAVNIDEIRVYRPRQSDTISSDSPVETLYDEQEVSHGSNRSNQGQFKDHRKTSSQKSPSRLLDRRTATTTGGSRMGVSGRDNQTRQTRATTRGRNKQAEKPVRSNQANTRRPCPYYLRSRIQEKDGIPEELSNIEINGIPRSTLRRRSLSMEALDGDPVHRI
ncbi:uncharacterized protein TNCV_108851 [Trichonephila clavipes]|nr:uncharacterized protein TNCV_108851 [Trichonephila clavipes]